MPTFLIVWLWALVVVPVILVILRPNKHVTWLALIALLVAVTGWVVYPENPGISLDRDGDGFTDFENPLAFRQGLDLAGGVKILLEAQTADGSAPAAGQMDEVSRIVGNRIDSLGALEPVIQIQGERRLIVELPGFEDAESAIELMKGTAQLEFVDFGSVQIPAGTQVTTTLGLQRAGIDPEEFIASALEGDEENTDPDAFTGPVYETVMTGDILSSASAVTDALGANYYITFSLTADGSDQFGEYTTTHVGQVLGIVVDGVVISSPSINQAITGGQGQITGQFTQEEAFRLATQLQYGALPLALDVESSTTVGPTLGKISVERSIEAGIVGIIIVMVFMIIYYRVPGVAAALALLVFALINLAIYKLIPVTMTLPAITGFLIGVGTAVDGNILIFERFKEELLSGKRLGRAFVAGFDRAFPSIRDSNISTIIICVVLWLFGTSFGAGAVRGFAVTLALSLVINLFTAIIVTRTFLHFILLPFKEDVVETSAFWMGIRPGAEIAKLETITEATEDVATARRERRAGRKSRSKTRRRR